MSEKVLAKDAKAGQWYLSNRYGIMLCCRKLVFWTKSGHAVSLHGHDGLTHLPDCTGWDWNPPSPEKKYRAFVTWQEWWPHRDRWGRLGGDRVKFCWRGNECAAELFRDAAVFLNDDGTDAEPFGVEVTE